MAKRNKVPTIQVFNVSWWPMYANEPATIMCLSRENAHDRTAELKQSFAAYPNHDPQIRTTKARIPVSF